MAPDHSASQKPTATRSRQRTIALEALEPRLLLNGSPATEVPKLVVEYHEATEEDMAELKLAVGVSTEDVDYTVTVDGHGTGYRAPTEDEWDAMVGNLRIADTVDLASDGPAQPASIDWSASIYFPPIGNQDGEGSCTTWAVAYYTKTFQEAMEHGWDLSTVSWVGGYSGAPDSQLDHIFSPDFLYHQINNGGDYGSWSYDAADIIDTIGAATWNTMPYDPADSTTWPTEAAWREAPLYRGDGPAYFLDTSMSIDGLKDLLASGNLAQISLNSDDMYEMSTLDNFINATTNHCVTVVGYDDNWSYTEGGATHYGAFKIANSWGPTWTGETTNDGCFWISYEAMRQRVTTVTYFDDLTGYEPEIIAVFEISQPDRGEVEITAGVGTSTSPVAMKNFISPQMASDGDDPFPSNAMVLDLTEFAGLVTLPENFFLRALDGGTGTTGTVVSFSIEMYSDYAGGVPDAVGVSLDTPLATQQGAYVYAELMIGSVMGGSDLVPYSFGLGTTDLFGYTSGDLSYRVLNGGDTPAGAFDVNFYLSDDEVLDGSDYHLGTDTVPGLSPFSSYDGQIPITGLPTTDPYATDGDYYLLFTVDEADDVTEVIEDNNLRTQAVNWARGAVFYDDFSTNMGWTGYTSNGWERGIAQAGGGVYYGNPDPGTDATPTGDNYLLGYNIGGDYQNSLSSIIWITSPVIDCSNITDVTLEFQRWLNVEGWYDYAAIDVYDGSSWVMIYENPYSDVTDGSWQSMQYDVAAYADGNSSFQVRFGMGPTDSVWRFSGWNVDDVRVIGTMTPETVPPVVVDLTVKQVNQVPVDSITVYFSEYISYFALIDPANYMLEDDLGAPVAFDLVTGPDYAEFALTGDPLSDGDYTLTVSDALTDAWGNALDGDSDSVAGGDFVFDFTFKVPGLAAGTIGVYGGSITFYDTTEGITVNDIDVRMLADVKGNENGIKKVTLKPQYSEFGVVIEQMAGSDQAISVYDKTFAPTPISFIVVDGNVSKLSLRSNLAGYDINGVTIGNGVDIPLDADHDGDTEDPLGLLVMGDAGKLQTSARIMGDVSVDGNLDKVYLKNSYAELQGDLNVEGALGKLKVKSDALGDISVGQSAGTIDVRGDLIGATIDVAGVLGKLSVRGDYVDSSVTAYMLGSVKIKGDAYDTDCGQDVIHALFGEFDLHVGRERYLIDWWHDQTFDGGLVRAYVG